MKPVNVNFELAKNIGQSINQDECIKIMNLLQAKDSVDIGNNLKITGYNYTESKKQEGRLTVLVEPMNIASTLKDLVTPKPVAKPIPQPTPPSKPKKKVFKKN